MNDRSDRDASDDARKRRIREAGRRAIAEAEKRRKPDANDTRPIEVGGPDGPEPTRFGDWQKDGITRDF